jgi:hypothetical protein
VLGQAFPVKFISALKQFKQFIFALTWEHIRTRQRSSHQLYDCSTLVTEVMCIAVLHCSIALHCVLFKSSVLVLARCSRLLHTCAISTTLLHILVLTAPYLHATVSCTVPTYCYNHHYFLLMREHSVYMTLVLLVCLLHFLVCCLLFVELCRYYYTYGCLSTHFALLFCSVARRAAQQNSSCSICCSAAEFF